MTEILSTLATYGSIIPGVGIQVKAAIVTYKEGFKWIYALISNQNKMMSALIDAKIEKALAISATSQINAEIESIKNRIQRMENQNIIVEERKAEVIPALHSCEKILTLFRDENFCLWKAVVISSQLLIAFVAIYADVIKRTLELLPSYKTHLNSELNKTVETLQKYKRAVITERLKAVYIKVTYNSNIIHPILELYIDTILGDGTNDLEELEDFDSKLPPWSIFFCSTISDKWVPWSVYFNRYASYQYKSYRNNLQDVYESQFNDVVQGLNNLRTLCNH